MRADLTRVDLTSRRSNCLHVCVPATAVFQAICASETATSAPRPTNRSKHGRSKLPQHRGRSQASALAQPFHARYVDQRATQAAT
eukprot:6173171-Pleurochrysis_carterae.AAC.4